MVITLKWHDPIALQDGDSDNLIFKIPDIHRYHDIYGVYMFCRIYGDKLIPLYIGKAGRSIGIRLKQHLRNDVKLMKSIEKATNGKKVVVAGQFISQQGQDITKTIRIIEKHLIKTALMKGYKLFNDKGTKFPTDTIEFKGHQRAKNVFGTSLLIKKGK